MFKPFQKLTLRQFNSDINSNKCYLSSRREISKLGFFYTYLSGLFTPPSRLSPVTVVLSPRSLSKGLFVTRRIWSVDTRKNGRTPHALPPPPKSYRYT